MDIDSIDYTDPSLTSDPYRLLGYLSEHRPVYREPHHGVVMVTGHEEAIAVLRSPHLFSSASLIVGPDPWSLFPERPDGDDITEYVNSHREYLPQNDQIVTADPPTHTAQRALLIIADLLGVPEEDHAMLLARRGIRQMPGAMGQAMPGGADHLSSPDERAQSGGSHNSLEIFYDYFSEKIAERRQQPLNDVLTGMAQALFPDGTVPEPLQVARIASNLFAAGQETTVRLIATALRRIADEPETQAQLRAHPDLVPRFIEETLRSEGPILGEYRLALKTTELGGVHIPAGTQIFLSNGAANLDPRQFECPAEFRVTRENVRRHVAFGHGIHTCPGAPLARSEVRITIERLLDRTTDIRINEAAHGPAGSRHYDHLKSHMFHGIATLHLDFTAGD